MKISDLKKLAKGSEIRIRAVLGSGEFRQLNGFIDNLVVFSADMIKHKTNAIKTGARHSYARYLLLPVKIRKMFQTDTHDFDSLSCGAVEYKDKIYLVFCLERKDGGMVE
jgi:hypothetical protein